MGDSKASSARLAASEALLRSCRDGPRYAVEGGAATTSVSRHGKACRLYWRALRSGGFCVSAPAWRSTACATCRCTQTNSRLLRNQQTIQRQSSSRKRPLQTTTRDASTHEACGCSPPRWGEIATGCAQLSPGEGESSGWRDLSLLLFSTAGRYHSRYRFRQTKPWQGRQRSRQII